MSTTTGRREFLRAAAVTSAGLALAKLLPAAPAKSVLRSEEHTSELQSRLHLVCRLLLEKKKKTSRTTRPLIKNGLKKAIISPPKRTRRERATTCKKTSMHTHIMNRTPTHKHTPIVSRKS